MCRYRPSLISCFAAALAVAAASAHPSLREHIAELSLRIERSPSDPELLRERGIAYANDGQSERAIADFRSVERLGDPVLVAFDQGVLHYRMGQLDAARAYLSTYLQRFPNHPHALEYRARAARDAGDARAALADFEALFAVEKHPNPGDYASAAELLESLPGEGSAAALALLDRGMLRLGTIPQLQRPAITLERRAARYDAAIARLRTLEAALGASPEWKVELGELHGLAGRREEAARWLARARAQLLERRPTPANAALEARIAELLAR